MSLFRETVYLDRDNVIRLELREDEELLRVKYPGLVPTKWELIIATTPPTTISSDTHPEAFNWEGDVSVLEIAIQAVLTQAFSDFTAVTLILYSAEFPNGLIYLHPLYTRDILKINAIVVS